MPNHKFIQNILIEYNRKYIKKIYQQKYIKKNPQIFRNEKHASKKESQGKR